MNGNNPYAGSGNVVNAGERMGGDAPKITPENRRALSEGVARIATRTREFLPTDFAVNATISAGVHGPQVTVAVEPPVGNPVSAGFEPELDDGDDDFISTDDREEVARGLAASAALQVKYALGDDVDAAAK
jgi:hypothetical protein